MTLTNFAEMIAEYEDVLKPGECKKIIEKFEYDNRKSKGITCLLYTSPSPRDISGSRMPSSA